ncbi:MAG: galactose mutarotase [Bacteroidetes bacterium]|nr:galactose mutarotase [Bacteroidota bacterium]
MLTLIAAVVLFSGCHQKTQDSKNTQKNVNMEIKKELFGNIDGKDVYLFTMENSKGMQVQITNYGGIVTSIKVPDKNGKFDDIVLGYDSLKGYLIETPYFGAIVGRCANRISYGKFTLDGKTYTLSTNEGPHHLHGGTVGFDKKIWDPTPMTDDSTSSLKLTYTSPDGEEGYPGTLDVTVVYTLTNDNKFQIEYTAKTDKATPINLTHHTYFNLAGTSGRNILDHVLMIDADKYCVTNPDLTPTGEIRDVEGTNMDFRTPMTIGARIGMVPGGYDHNYVLNNNGQFGKVAELYDPKSGRVIEVYTTEPGMQFYSGNFLDGSIVGEYGLVYQKHYGLCMETQHFPDSPNHPNFPNNILRPGETYKQLTIYKFGVK